MDVYIVITLDGGVLNEVIPYLDRDVAIMEFQKQAERMKLEITSNSENFLNKSTGNGYYTDEEGYDEVHLQKKILD